MAEIPTTVERYLLKELSSEEHEQLAQWLTADEANRRAFLVEVDFYRVTRQVLIQEQHALAELTGEDDLNSLGQDIHATLHLPAPAEERSTDRLTKQDLKAAASYILSHALRSRYAVYVTAAAVLVLAAVLFIVFAGPGDQPGNTAPGELAISLDPPAERVRPTVIATMIDVDSPLWADRQGPSPDGFAAGRYRLHEGAVRIELADGTRVKLTAPVDFEITGRNEIGISAGELVANVPPQAIGFRVRTPAGDVVDLGTTFGVRVRDDQTTDVQVVEGLVRVAARDRSGELGDFVELTTMQAARLDNATERVVSIPADADRFTMDYVRKIDLVDVVAGGDGTGRARMRALHPVTGEAMDKPLTGIGGDLRVPSVGRYQPVRHNRFIDGVFVPDRADGVQVDSAGHTVDGLVITEPESYQVIWAGGVLPALEAPEMSEHLARLYPDQDLDRVAVLCMIPNKGITFDLDAARSALRTRGGVHYKMVVQNLSLRHNESKNRLPKADIICYLDGKAVSRTIGLTPEDGGVEVAFDVPADTRFLSIVVTDSGDKIGRDWVVFHRPQIVLKQAGPRGTPEP